MEAEQTETQKSSTRSSIVAQQCVSSCSVPLVALFMAAFSSSTLALPQVSTVKVNGLSSFAYLQLHVRGVSKLFSSQWVFVSKL